MAALRVNLSLEPPNNAEREIYILKRQIYTIGVRTQPTSFSDPYSIHCST